MTASGRALVVLGWHNVEGTWCFPSAPGAGLRGLEWQLRVLRRSTNVVPLGWALRTMSAGRPLPPRAVAITFDDGYRDNLTLAAPLLRRLGLPATCFLVPGLLSREVTPWWERLAWAFANSDRDRIVWEDRSVWLGTSTASRHTASTMLAAQLKRRDRRQRDAAVDDLVSLLSPAGEYRVDDHFLDWEGARKLRATMEIGSHSMHHAILARESAGAQRDDLVTSRQKLADELSEGIELLAYPNGGEHDYDEDTLAAVESAGYEYAITTRRGRNTAATPPYEVRRWVMSPERGPFELGKIVRDVWRENRGRLG